MKKYFVVAFICCASLFCFNIGTVFAQNDFWEATNGPNGGSIYSLAINTNGYIFTTTIGRGVYRSTDQGNHWEQRSNGLPQNAHAFALFISRKGTILLATADSLYRSTDDGAHWFAVFYSPFGTFFGLTHYFTEVPSGNIYYAGRYGGIFQSTDDGLTWMKTIGGVEYVHAITSNSKGYLFVATDGSGVLRSINQGEVWVEMNNGLTNRLVWSVSCDAQGNLFAGTETGIFRSTDDGISWKVLPNIAPFSPPLSFAYSAGGDMYVGCAGAGIIHSSDEGNSWEFINSGLTFTSVWSLIRGPEGNLYAATSYGGVYRSTDNGMNWSQFNEGLIGSDVRCIIANKQGYIFASTDNGIYRSQDNGNTWLRLNNQINDQTVFSFLIDDQERIIAGAYTDIFISTDNGDSWNKSNGMTSYNVISLAMNSQGHLFAVTLHYKEGRVFRSRDHGMNWEQIMKSYWIYSSYAVCVDKFDNIYVSTDNGVHRSTDGGDSWVRPDSSLIYSRAFSLTTNSSGYIFAGTEYGIYRSTSSGSNWQPIKSNLTFRWVYSLAIDNANQILAGSSEGVLRSTDNGDTWALLNSGLFSTDVRSLASSPSGIMYVGLFGGGVYRSTKPVTSINPQAQSFPNQFTLDQNYPNPFSTSTTIHYSIPKHDYVTLIVYDCLGREFATLVDEEKDAGEYEKSLVISNWSFGSQGLYFYRLSVSGYSQTRTMLFMSRI